MGPVNPHDYLHWWKYDGPEAWRAGCHFSDIIHRWLQPVMEEKIDFNKYWKDKTAKTIVDSLFYLTLCEHQAVLADNAVCIHNRMLSDDVLRCSGVIGWNKGNKLMFQNLKPVLALLYISVYTPGDSGKEPVEKVWIKQSI